MNNVQVAAQQWQQMFPQVSGYLFLVEGSLYVKVEAQPAEFALRRLTSLAPKMAELTPWDFDVYYGFTMAGLTKLDAFIRVDDNHCLLIAKEKILLKVKKRD